ncbi:hypothetical protein R3P38DRAFT_3179275 [Favolaschia claudopus]|uniref:Uncharacterized protein n=1 Tax=Favolaschia claudopus TaxID=2862362 RepID=A0AAW0CUG9_9AGAR
MAVPRSPLGLLYLVPDSLPSTPAVSLDTPSPSSSSPPAASNSAPPPSTDAGDAASIIEYDTHAPGTLTDILATQHILLYFLPFELVLSILDLARYYVRITTEHSEALYSSTSLCCLVSAPILDCALALGNPGNQTPSVHRGQGDVELGEGAAQHPRIHCPLPLHEYNVSSSLLYLVPLLPLPPPSVPRTLSNPRPTKGRTQHHHLWEWHTDTLCRSRDLCVLGYLALPVPIPPPSILSMTPSSCLAFYKDTAASNPPSSIYNLAPTLSLRPPPASSSRTAVVALRRRNAATFTHSLPLPAGLFATVACLPTSKREFRPAAVNSAHSVSFSALQTYKPALPPSYVLSLYPQWLRHALPGLALWIPPALSNFTTPLPARLMTIFLINAFRSTTPSTSMFLSILRILLPCKLQLKFAPPWSSLLLSPACSLRFRHSPPSFL